MKKIGLSSLLILANTCIYAQIDYMSGLRVCEATKAAANVAQSYRQLGLTDTDAKSMLLAFNPSIKDEGNRNRTIVLVNTVVTEAFNFPILETRELKDQAIKAFTENKYSQCLRELNSRK